jgi:hypothetical protein
VKWGGAWLASRGGDAVLFVSSAMEGKRCMGFLILDALDLLAYLRRAMAASSCRWRFLQCLMAVD